MTFYMSTSSKKSEQWKEILGENIKLENEGDKMRAHAGEGRLCPSSLSTLPIAFAIPANRRIFHPLHKYLEQDLEPSVSYLDSGVFVHWCGLRRANVVMCVWGWGPGTQGREQYWVNLVQKKGGHWKIGWAVLQQRHLGTWVCYQNCEISEMWKSAELRFVACVAQVAWGVSVESVGFRCIATIIPSHYYTSIDTIILREAIVQKIPEFYEIISQTGRGGQSNFISLIQK